jgi:hypothetical protein
VRSSSRFIGLFVASHFLLFICIIYSLTLLAFFDAALIRLWIRSILHVRFDAFSRPVIPLIDEKRISVAICDFVICRNFELVGNRVSSGWCTMYQPPRFRCVPSRYLHSSGAFSVASHCTPWSLDSQCHDNFVPRNAAKTRLSPTLVTLTPYLGVNACPELIQTR